MYLNKAFRNVNKSYYFLDMPIKLKGYLLKLYSICNLRDLTVKLSKNKIAKLIRVTKASQNKYNAELIKLGYLREVADELVITCPGLDKTDKKQVCSPETMKEINERREIIYSHLEASPYKGQKITREILDNLLANGLDKQTHTIGLYLLKSFSGVKNIDNLVAHILYGPRRSTPECSFTL
jgi:hypothetical protein